MMDSNGVNRVPVTIDFEIFNELDIKKSSPWAYAEHPSCAVICMAWRFEGEESASVWTPLRGDVLNGLDPRFTDGTPLLIEAHNSEFEQAIWELLCVSLYGFTKDVIWECSASRCASLSLPRKLERVCTELGTVNQKDMEGHKVMQRMAKPRKPSKTNSSTNWFWCDDRLHIVMEYCKQDVECEWEISNTIDRLSFSELRLWRIDQKINKLGINIDFDLVNSAFNISAEYKARLNRELAILTDGEITSGTQQAKVLKVLQREIGPKIQSISADVLELWLSRDISDKAKRVIEIRLAVSKNSVAKYEAFDKRASLDGRARSLFMFYGAGTGRWAGKAVQPQNLASGRGMEEFDKEVCIEAIKFGSLDYMECFYPEPMEYLSACVRGAIIPSKGKEFICIDYSGIEARVLAWLVGEKKMLKMFFDKKDIYKDLASSIYSVGIDEVTKDQRNLGKQGILGLGYGMGVSKFISTCESYGIEVPYSTAELAVKTYREKYYKVKRFWYKVEDCATQAVATGKEVHCGKISFSMRNDFLQCKLPSDRKISYYSPRVVEKETPWGEMKDGIEFRGPIEPSKQFGWCDTYGGKLVENIIQGIARDILAVHLVKLDKHPVLETVMHVHDEALIEDYLGTPHLADAEEIMTAVPSFCKGLPLAIETWTGPRFRK